MTSNRLQIPSRLGLIVTMALGSMMADPAFAARLHHVQKVDAVQALLGEVKALRNEVIELRTSQATLQARLDALQASSHSQEAIARANPLPTQIAAAPSVPLDQVKVRVIEAADKSHADDQLHFKGITIKPGGYIELAGLYREHFQGNDIASSFLIPFPNSHAFHTSEARFSARQSRLSFLAQGKVSETTQLAMYGEFDFLGAAQTANSNQSNSYNPRVRNLYGTLEVQSNGYGLHFLAGQSWSLVTLNARGILPRTELPPPVIESQNTPGFYWARQPAMRLAVDILDHRFWLAASVENPQTTVAGVVPANITYNQTAGLGFDNANTLSFNHIPDVIGKVAYDANVASRTVHVEGFGIFRRFDEHFIEGEGHHLTTFGYGGGIVAQVVPNLLDVQVSGIVGRGIGRYGSVGLPDITFSSDGRIHPIDEHMLLVGLTLHAPHNIDLYGLAGEEQEEVTSFPSVNGTPYGIGNLSTDNRGCLVEGGNCLGNTRRVRQLTFGIWDRIYTGPFGKALVGMQYSLTYRELFLGMGGEPAVNNKMGFLSFRYYPF